MITQSQFLIILARAKKQVWDSATRNLSNYGDFPRRVTFTRLVLEVYEAMTGQKFNPSGSFLESKVNSIMQRDVQWEITNFEFRIELKGQLARLEKGIVSFKWFVNKWPQYKKRLLALQFKGQKGMQDLIKRVEQNMGNPEGIQKRPREYFGEPMKRHTNIVDLGIRVLISKELPNGSWQEV